MALTDFFRINMPYGMQRNTKGEWMFFNREYTSLGNYISDTIAEDSSYYCKYVGITDSFLESLAEKDSIVRNDKGEVVRIWFYNDRTTPSHTTVDDELWNSYMNKLKKLCNLTRVGI